MQTNPQCFLHTLMHCCLRSETMISFNVGRKCRFCDWNATFDASICYAAMATKSRRRRKQEQAWKQEQGDSDDQVGINKKTTGWNCYHHMADTYGASCAKLQNVWILYVYQHQLYLFVFHLQVFVILETQQACYWEHSHLWRCIRFQSWAWNIDRHEQVWSNIKFSVEGGKKENESIFSSKELPIYFRLLKRCLINCTLLWLQSFWCVELLHHMLSL